MAGGADGAGGVGEAARWTGVEGLCESSSQATLYQRRRQCHIGRTKSAIRGTAMKLKVNGSEVEVTSEADTPLLWVLRDELQLVGTEYGCGIAQCGACTVHMDGRAIRSCVTPVAAAENREIQTIEGQEGEQGLSAVQRAWLETDVAQCGYCQSGQIMAASALLAENPRPNDAEIDAAMSGNICRCGTYPRIRKAVHLAAQWMSEERGA